MMGFVSSPSVPSIEVIIMEMITNAVARAMKRLKSRSWTVPVRKRKVSRGRAMSKKSRTPQQYCLKETQLLRD